MPSEAQKNKGKGITLNALDQMLQFKYKTLYLKCELFAVLKHIEIKFKDLEKLKAKCYQNSKNKQNSKKIRLNNYRLNTMEVMCC